MVKCFYFRRMADQTRVMADQSLAKPSTSVKKASACLLVPSLCYMYMPLINALVGRLGHEVRQFVCGM